MAAQSRYMVGQKLSDYQFEKILRDFAYGVQASEALKRTPTTRRTRAPNTVFRIYDLVRRRLLEIGYFPEPVEFFKWTQSSSEIADGFTFSKTAQNLEVERLRGVSDESARFHLAEIIFRADNADRSPAAIYIEILAAIRLTGPLNRPPRNLDLWEERSAINLYQRQIDRLRRMPHHPHADHRELIDRYQVMIAKVQRRLRKKIRERSSSGKTKELRGAS